MVPKPLVELWERHRRVLVPLSWIYGGIIRARDALYERGLVERKRPARFSVVVGNLSLGGEGKTPFTLLLAELLTGMGIKVAVVTRGYGRRGRSREPMEVKRDGGCEFFGDEALLYATKLKGVPIFVGKARIKASDLAVKKTSPQVLLFDDAYQHRRLAADLYILVVSATYDPFSERLFPAGRLREPVSAAERADVVFVTKANLFPERALELKERFSKTFGKEVFFARFEDGPLTTLTKDGFEVVSWTKPRRVFGFCGIGDSTSFLNLLKKRRFEVVGFKKYPDHYLYEAKDLERLFKEAASKGAEVLITTEKDMVRIPKELLQEFPIVALSLLVRIEKKGLEFLLKRFEKMF